MTIQSAFNEITETLGGTPSTDGTITGAIDALNDTLAGENQERGNSIEDAVRLLGEHIGSGGSSEFSTVLVTFANTSNENGFTFGPPPESQNPLLEVVRDPGGSIAFLSQITTTRTIGPSTDLTYEFLKILDINIVVEIGNVTDEPSIEGDIEEITGPWIDYAISGNCTITAEGNKLPK